MRPSKSDGLDGSPPPGSGAESPRPFSFANTASANLVAIVAVAAVYYLAGKVGLHFASFSPSSSSVWPPAGIAFGALLVLGNRIWPGVLIGAFLVNFTTTGNLATSIAIAAGNTAEAVLGAYLVRRYANGGHVFERAQDIFKFAAAATLFATPVSALIGVGSLTMCGFVSWSDVLKVWVTWWLGDVGGYLLFAPPIVLWAEQPRLALGGLELIERAIAVSGLAAVAAVVFGNVLPPGMRDYPIGFLYVPLLIWAAFRFGRRDTASAVLVYSLIAIFGTQHGFGAFARAAPNGLILLQAFTATISMTALTVSTLVWERKRAEADANLARDAAEESNRAKDEFLAMLGHELRNPLAAISSAVRVLERDNPPSGQSSQVLEIISRQSRHLARLLDDLLDVGRVTTGRITLSRRPTNLAECVDSCLSTLKFRDELGGRKLTVRTEPVWIDGDPDRVAQMLSNLLSNAVKYTPPDGEIRVAAFADNDDAVLRVEDNGSGIQPELLPRVFDLFVRGDHEQDRTHAGLGIGLTLVRRLVDLHGGVVEAASAGPHKGSSFVIRLPRINVVVEHAPTTPATPGAVARRRVLIIEDDPDARTSLRMVLEQMGHEVVEAAEAFEGISMATRGIDAAIVDIGLPELDGYTVARRIRSQAECRNILLLALTGYGQPDDRRKSAAAGFDAHLVKPVDFDRLAELLAKLNRE